jgi:arylsulfatase A-like enzyme
MLGTKLPVNAGEDSFSLLPLLKGGSEPIRQHAISHASSGLPSLRDGHWKIIFGSGAGGFANAAKQEPPATDRVQLYDLSTDLGEAKNVAANHPELVAKLTKVMEKLVNDGRSTPGPVQQNDVAVNWQRFQNRETAPNKAPAKKGAAKNAAPKKNAPEKANNS